MLLQLKPLFMGEIEDLPLDCELDFSRVEFQGMFPFARPVQVTGRLRYTAGVVTLRAQAALEFDGRCDRCAAPFRRPMVVPVEHVLVASLNDEENDDFVLLENYRLPLDSLVETDILLSLPTKNLCREDCRGLCPRCGKDLNDGLCGCREPAVDPRLEALRQLLE